MQPFKSRPQHMFSCEFCKNFKDTFFSEHLGRTASEMYRVSFLSMSFYFFGQIYFGKHNSQNLYNYLKEQRFYFATICVESLFSCSFAASFQETMISMVESVFNNVCGIAKYKLYCRCLMLKFSEILMLACRKIFCAFYPILMKLFPVILVSFRTWFFKFPS